MKAGKSKVLKNFKGKSYELILTKAGVVTAALHKQNTFKTVDAELKAVEETYADCKTKYEASLHGSVSEKDAAQKAKLLLIAAMSQLADACNLEANGDRVLLATSGFDLSKDTRSNLVLGPIGNFGTQPGMNAGDLLVGFDSQKAIRSVIYRYTYGDGILNAEWKILAGSKSSYLITGLIPGQLVTVNAIAIGPNNQVSNSPSVTTVVPFNQSGKKIRRGTV